MTNNIGKELKQALLDNNENNKNKSLAILENNDIKDNINEIKIDYNSNEGIIGNCKPYKRIQKK